MKKYIFMRAIAFIVVYFLGDNIILQLSMMVPREIDFQAGYQL